MSPIGNPVYPPSSSAVSIQGATSEKISIITATLANTEYSLALQTDLKQLRIKARNNASLRMAFVAGDTNNGSPYWTISRGCCENIDAISFTGKTLYIRANIALTEVEVMELY